MSDLPKNKKTLEEIACTARVESDEELEKVQWRVCSQVRCHEDDVEEHCAKCHCPVYLRPHGPKKPLRICIQCATIELGMTGGNAVGMINKETLEELKHGK